MGDYKQLNRELIDGNRELKQLVATLQKELVLIRAELMEQHRIRVEAEYNCRDRILSMLAKNFVTSIYEIDADINIMELLGYKDCIQQNTNAGTVEVSGEQSGGRVRSSRRSTQLVRDFRRSSAACRQQSVVQMSPTRRVHDDDAGAIEEENESDDDDRAASSSDMELDESINVINVENDDSGRNEELHCINEGSDEECDDEEDTKIGEESKAQQLRKQNPLRDLSNHSFDNISTRTGNIATKRGKEHVRISGSENSIEEARRNAMESVQRPTQFELDMQIEDDLVSSMHHSLHLTPDRASNARAEKQHENIACMEKKNRHLVVRLQRYQPLMPQIIVHTEDTITAQVPENVADITRKHDATELSLGLTEYSLGNFLEAHCSTPCSNETAKTREKKTNNAATGDEVSAVRSDEACNTPSFDNSAKQSMRPSRKCIPKTLAEPSLRKKLRSETGKSNTRSKKR